MCEDQATLWNLIILAATLFVLCIYTFLTHKLHRASVAQTRELVRQRRLSVLPSLVHEVDQGGLQSEKKLLIRNVGNGAAVNVRMERVLLSIDQNSYFEAEPIGTIQPGESKEARGKTFIENEEFEDSFTLIIHEKEAESRTYDIQFQFQDIEGRHYTQRNRIISGIYHHGAVEETTQGVVADSHARTGES